MANNKIGFEYYNVDTNRYQDIKIKRLKKDFKTAGIAVYDYILCEIYRVKGCFLVWDENTAFDVAEYFGLKETLVNEIVNYCAAVGLFDKELLRCGSKSLNESNCGDACGEGQVRTCGGIITSRSIQRRFMEMSARAKRKDPVIPKEINILTEESKIIPEQSPIIPEVSDKGKKSKVNIPPSNTHAHVDFPLSDVLDKPVLDCYNELVSNRMWAETVTMNTRMAGNIDFTLNTFYEYLKKFFAKLQNEGETMKSIKDAMSHFARWLDIELKKQRDDRARAKTFGGSSKAARPIIQGETRKTTGVQSDSTARKDYSGSF